jgi:hypothetical protein
MAGELTNELVFDLCDNSSTSSGVVDTTMIITMNMTTDNHIRLVEDREAEAGAEVAIVVAGHIQEGMVLFKSFIIRINIMELFFLNSSSRSRSPRRRRSKSRSSRSRSRSASRHRKSNSKSKLVTTLRDGNTKKTPPMTKNNSRSRSRSGSGWSDDNGNHKRTKKRRTWSREASPSKGAVEPNKLMKSAREIQRHVQQKLKEQHEAEEKKMKEREREWEEEAQEIENRMQKEANGDYTPPTVEKSPAKETTPVKEKTPQLYSPPPPQSQQEENEEQQPQREIIFEEASIATEVTAK